MDNWIKNNGPNLRSLAILLVASLAVFAVSRGTEFQQFGVGALCATIALFVALAIFEALWQAAAAVFGLNLDGASDSTSRSHDDGAA
jgi:hypothetical protein